MKITTRRIDRCPACGQHAIETVINADETAVRRYLDYSRIKYDGLLDDWLHSIELAVDHCPACDHYWYREQPDTEMLAAMYSASRPLTGIDVTPSRNPTAVIRDEMRRLRHLITKEQPRLLDYGSGFGRWARAAVTEGFLVTAYEPSTPRGAENSEINFTIIHERGSLEGLHFDVINLEQVLEHVPDPVAVLSDLHGLCTSGALVRIAVPNVLRSPEGVDLWQEWPFNGRRPHTMAPFEHLHGFTPRSLKTAVCRAGFVPASGWEIWYHYPLAQIRRHLATMMPSMGQTCILAKAC